MARARAIVMAACWIAFALTWLAGAIYNAVKGPRTRQRSRSFTAWRFAIAAVVALGSTEHAHFWKAITVHIVVLDWLGVGLTVLATALTLWARGTLGRMWSSAPMVKEHHELRTSGPYAITRHPIYTGLIGMIIGSCLAYGFGVWGPVAVAAVVALTLKARDEERLMVQQFPGAYEDYRRRVPRLIPGLRWSRQGFRRPSRSKP